MTPQDDDDVLTDVDLDGETVFVLPRSLAVAVLSTWACLTYATDFVQTRTDRDARALVEEHLPIYLEQRRAYGDEDSDGSDDEPFDAGEYFGADDWVVWTPNARLLTASFLASSAPQVAERYLRPDTAWGHEYEPAPFVHASDRAALEQELTVCGHRVQAWPGLAECFLTPPLDPALRLGVR